MRPAVLSWVRGQAQRHKPEAPVLEVGALDMNGTCRPFFPQAGYLGIDLTAGKGVDLQIDILDLLTALPQYAGHFATVLTTETLEHIPEVRLAIGEMYKALRPVGLFIGTWCFAFPIHDAPRDYWRVTPYGFQFVLQRAGFHNVEIETEGCNRPPGRPPDEGDWQWPVGVFATARKPR